jgi:hypothetical protein
VRPRSPPQFDKVFVIAEAIDHSEYFDLLGTSFAITSRHVITAYHNLGDGLGMVGGAIGNIGNIYSIARVAKKVSDKSTLIDPFDVTFCLGNDIEDWAILELRNSAQKFTSFFHLCEINDLPDILMRPKLKALYAPIGQYRVNSFRELKIWASEYELVLQFEEEDKKIFLDGGLYRGSCGAPYIDENNKVVALHLASLNEGREFSYTKKKRTIKDLEEVMTDQSDVHHSIREGLVLALVPAIQKFITDDILKNVDLDGTDKLW